jgi:hypothetical protein
MNKIIMERNSVGNFILFINNLYSTKKINQDERKKIINQVREILKDIERGDKFASELILDLDKRK